MSNTRKITASAVMIAMSFVLALLSRAIPLEWMQGGSITLASAVPVITASIVCGTAWGILSALIFSILQMMIGFYPPPTADFLSFILVVLLDYVIAFGVYGLSGMFYRILGKKDYAIPISGVIVLILRYISHILSGILIWGAYAQEQTVLAYSVTYNGGYMLPEIIITAIVLTLLIPIIKRIAKRY